MDAYMQLRQDYMNQSTVAIQSAYSVIGYNDATINDELLKLDTNSVHVDTSFSGLSADSSAGSSDTDHESDDPQNSAQIDHLEDQQDASTSPTTEPRVLTTTRGMGTFNNPLLLEEHNKQTTYRNICAFSCRSKTWVTIGHITTNILRCPNLATGKYFCDRCYNVVVKKNNIAPPKWTQIQHDAPQSARPACEKQTRTSWRGPRNTPSWRAPPETAIGQ